MGRTKHCIYPKCNSDSRYFHKSHMLGVNFVPFPKPKRTPYICYTWYKWLKEVRKDFKVENITKQTYLCSKHFLGQHGPTEQCPNPVHFYRVPSESTCIQNLEEPMQTLFLTSTNSVIEIETKISHESTEDLTTTTTNLMKVDLTMAVSENYQITSIMETEVTCGFPALERECIVNNNESMGDSHNDSCQKSEDMCEFLPQETLRNVNMEVLHNDHNYTSYIQDICNDVDRKHLNQSSDILSSNITHNENSPSIFAIPCREPKCLVTNFSIDNSNLEASLETKTSKTTKEDRMKNKNKLKEGFCNDLRNTNTTTAAQSKPINIQPDSFLFRNQFLPFVNSIRWAEMQEQNWFCNFKSKSMTLTKLHNETNSPIIVIKINYNYTIEGTVYDKSLNSHSLVNLPATVSKSEELITVLEEICAFQLCKGITNKDLLELLKERSRGDFCAKTETVRDKNCFGLSYQKCCFFCSKLKKYAIKAKSDKPKTRKYKSLRKDQLIELIKRSKETERNARKRIKRTFFERSIKND